MPMVVVEQPAKTRSPEGGAQVNGKSRY
jgi:hypothetical protein